MKKKLLTLFVMFLTFAFICGCSEKKKKNPVAPVIPTPVTYSIKYEVLSQAINGTNSYLEDLLADDKIYYVTQDNPINVLDAGELPWSYTSTMSEDMLAQLTVTIGGNTWLMSSSVASNTRITLTIYKDANVLKTGTFDPTVDDPGLTIESTL